MGSREELKYLQQARNVCVFRSEFVLDIHQAAAVWPLGTSSLSASGTPTPAC